MSERTLDRLARVVVRRDLEIHRSHLGPWAARWHFSFADYQDPTHIGIGASRVFMRSCLRRRVWSRIRTVTRNASPT